MSPKHRATRSIWDGRIYRAVIAWLADEWKWLTIVIGGSVFVFAGIYLLQHFWPDETMAAWGPAWRIGLVIGAANVALVIALDRWVYPVDKPEDEDEHDPSCIICSSTASIAAAKADKETHLLHAIRRFETVR